MVQTLNIPVQMICCIGTLGNLTPMRFKFENDMHEIQTVNVTEILSRKETSLSGNKELRFTCSADIEDETKMFVLTYHINSHKWKLFQILT